jgi:hypothetical protein
MKAFVRLCNSKWIDPSQPVVQPRTCVEYTRDAHHWTMGYDSARAVCAQLNSARVRSLRHPEHCCLFDIEEVSCGAFAVLCVFHPDFTEFESEVAEPAFT